MIRYWHETNEREHIVSSTLFDSLSNINTVVITLRLPDQMKSGLLKQIQNVWPWFKKTSSERMEMVCRRYVGGPGVCNRGWRVSISKLQTRWFFLVGGLVTLVSFVNQFTSVFMILHGNTHSIVIHNTDVCARR